MLWAAVPAEEQSLNTGCPSPLVQEMGHEQVLQRCRQIRFPVAHQLPCRLTCPVGLAVGSRAEYIPVMGRLGELQTWTVSEFWLHLSS